VRLDPNDLAVAKLAAARDKDLEFLRVLFRSRLADASIVRGRVSHTRLPQDARARCVQILDSVTEP
jgi:hypothetical protein